MIAGMGFAQMAIKEANGRTTCGAFLSPKTGPAPRNSWRCVAGFPSAEYYRICDAAQRGFDVIMSERSRGWYLSDTWAV